MLATVSVEHPVSQTRERESKGNGPFRFWARCLSLMATQSTSKYSTGILQSAFQILYHIWTDYVIPYSKFLITGTKSNVLFIGSTFKTFFSTPSAFPSLGMLEEKSKHGSKSFAWQVALRTNCTDGRSAIEHEYASVAVPPKSWYCINNHEMDFEAIIHASE